MLTKSGDHSGNSVSVGNFELILRRIETTAIIDCAIVGGGLVKHKLMGGKMYLLCPGLTDNTLHIPCGNAGTGHHLYTAGGILNHFVKKRYYE